jgi:hypothetical protein
MDGRGSSTGQSAGLSLERLMQLLLGQSRDGQVRPDLRRIVPAVSSLVGVAALAIAGIVAVAFVL